jgi:hypothetical protein
MHLRKINVLPPPLILALPPRIRGRGLWRHRATHIPDVGFLPSSPVPPSSPVRHIPMDGALATASIRQAMSTDMHRRAINEECLR